MKQKIQNILDRNFTRGDNAKALKELCDLFDVVGRSEQLCDHKGTTIAWGPDDDKCTKCGLTWDV